jgi:hypothetical protein
MCVAAASSSLNYDGFFSTLSRIKTIHTMMIWGGDVNVVVQVFSVDVNKE